MWTYSLNVKTGTQKWHKCFVRVDFLGKTQYRPLDCGGALCSSYSPKCFEQVTSKKKKKKNLFIPCIEELMQRVCMGLV